MNKEIFSDHHNENIFVGEKIGDSDQKWILTTKDIENAEKLYEEEKIHPLNKQNMFEGGLYCIFSIGETSKKQRNLFKILQEKKLNTPEQIISNKDKLKKVFEGNYKPRNPKRMFGFITKFSSWWMKSNLPQEILDDAKNNIEHNGIKFRDRLAERKLSDRAPGMGPKVASYFMVLCGYKDVVTIDKHMFDFCEDNFIYPDERPDLERGGLWLSRYKKFEEKISEIAKKHGLTPAMFCLALWTKYSSFSRNNS